MRLRVISLVVALSAVASAQSSTISACYNTTNGQMRYVNSSAACRGGENLVTWDSQGPKGDKGDQGDPGPNGDKGDTGNPGPSVGSAIVYTSGGVVAATVTDFTQYAHLTLPEGSYIVDAVVDVSASESASITCVTSAVHGSSATFQEKSFSAPPSPTPTFQLQGEMVYQIEAEGVTEAFVGCSSSSPAGVFLSRVSLRAVPVTEIHVQ